MLLKFYKPDTQKLLLFGSYVLFGSFVLWLAIYAYTHLGYYGFLSQQTRELLPSIGWVLIGILVVDGLYKLFWEPKFPDTGLTTLFVGLARLKFTGAQRTALLYLLVQLFFTPIMLNIMVGNSSALRADTAHLLNGTLNLDFQTGYYMLINTIFLVDTAVFFIAYLFTGKLLGNTVRSVQPLALGWIVALITYPPLNELTGQIFPLDRTLAATNDWTILLQVLVLLCHFMFLVATISLGMKSGNLTNKGIVSRGVYAYVRHPAYTFKLLAWFIEGFIFIPSRSYYFSWLGLAAIYAARAWTEERHLSTDPDYVAYKQKVKWWFVPRLV